MTRRTRPALVQFEIAIRSAIDHARSSMPAAIAGVLPSITANFPLGDAAVDRLFCYWRFPIMKALFAMLGVLILSTIASAAPPAGTYNVTCYSGATVIFSDTDAKSATTTANGILVVTDTSGIVTYVGGAGGVCVVVLTPSTSKATDEP
jgi:hypothetical protein